MTDKEVEYWLSELEADFRAGKMTGNYRNEEIHKALQQVIIERNNLREEIKIRWQMNYVWKMYCIIAIIILIQKLIK
jgi:hypothetical protein